MMGTFYKVIQKSSYKTGQLAKKVGGGVRTTTMPLGPETNEKKGGEGVTLSAVSNGQTLRINRIENAVIITSKYEGQSQV